MSGDNMKYFTVHTVVYCLFCMQLLPSNIEGGVLTKNIEVACPGETLIFTCVSEGFIQRWRLHPSADSSTTLAEISFQNGIDVAGRTATIMDQFNFTLISADYNNFTSVLTFIASEMHKGIAIECATPLSFSSKPVGIVEIPLPPRDFEIRSKEYHENFSSVTLVWSSPSLNQSQVQQIDHYQLMVETEGLNNTNQSLTYWINSTETMITISALPYNSNIFLSLAAHNCIGESQAVTVSYSAMRCGDINSSVLLIKGSLSQTPWSRVELICIHDPLSSVVAECQEDGTWRPEPANLMCDYGYYVSTNTFSTVSSLATISQLPVVNVSVSISVGITSLLLVFLAGFSIILCYATRWQYRKKLSELLTTTPMANTASGHNVHLYEEVSPIYETLSITVAKRGEEEMNEQEIFTHTAIQANNFTSGCIAEGIDMVDNEAYNRSLLLKDSITKATDNSSHTSAEHDYDVCSPTEGGVFESLYDDTVI